MPQKNRLALEQFLAYRVVRFASRLSDAVADVYTEPYSLTVAQWRVVATLAEHDGLTAKVIAAQTAMDKVKVSRAIKRLMSRSLLTRVATQQDGRTYQLSLTEAGWQLYHDIAPRAEAWQQQFLSEISAQEYELFMRIMTKLESKLDER